MLIAACAPPSPTGGSDVVVADSVVGDGEASLQAGDVTDVQTADATDVQTADAADATDATDAAPPFVWPDAASGSIPCGSTTCSADEYCVEYMPAMPRECGDAGNPYSRTCAPRCAPRTCDRTDDQWCTCVGCPGPSYCDALSGRTVYCHNL